jgi:hypothetical protein
MVSGALCQLKPNKIKHLGILYPPRYIITRRLGEVFIIGGTIGGDRLPGTKNQKILRYWMKPERSASLSYSARALVLLS